MVTAKDPSPVLHQLGEDQQDLVVRLGSGYRVIKGVAGSGKTVVLLERVRRLADASPDGRFAVFCFNAALAKLLKVRLDDRKNILVSTIDSFASAECSRQRLEPKGEDGSHFDERASLALAAAEASGGTAEQFDAVFVDEAQDLDATRLNLAFESLHDPDGDFVISYDTAQMTNRSGRVTRWTPPGGRTARGRTTLMRLNYRNTQEVLQHAYFYLRHGDAVVDNSDEPHDPDSIAHPMSSRSGPRPRTWELESDQAAVDAIVHEVASLLTGGESPDRIAVVCGNRALRTLLYGALKDAGIAPDRFVDLSFGHSFAALNKAEGRVHAASFHKLKGLEYKHVYLAGLDNIEPEGRELDPIDDPERLRRLVYTAMTRSTHNLTIVLHGHGPIIDELRGIQERLDSHWSGLG